MKLTYRGVSYEYTPNPAPKFGPEIATGHYRGAPTSFHTLAVMPAQPSEDLTWRGVGYRSGVAAPIPAMAVAPVMEPVVEPMMEPLPEMVVASLPEIEVTPVMTIAERARTLLMRHHQRIRQREQAMLTRLDVEVGLTPEDAARYEGHIQGKTCHGFSGYDRSGAAMS